MGETFLRAIVRPFHRRVDRCLGALAAAAALAALAVALLALAALAPTPPAAQAAPAPQAQRAARGGTPLSLLMVDIDHFKRYNDCLLYTSPSPRD